MLLKGAGKAATEPILKELAKHLRNGLVDKALVMRIACAQVKKTRWIRVTKIDDKLTCSLLVHASRYPECTTKFYSS